VTFDILTFVLLTLVA